MRPWQSLNKLNRVTAKQKLAPFIKVRTESNSGVSSIVSNGGELSKLRHQSQPRSKPPIYLDSSSSSKVSVRQLSIRANSRSQFQQLEKNPSELTIACLPETIVGTADHTVLSHNDILFKPVDISMKQHQISSPLESIQESMTTVNYNLDESKELANSTIKSRPTLIFPRQPQPQVATPKARAEIVQLRLPKPASPTKMNMDVIRKGWAKAMSKLVNSNS